MATSLKKYMCIDLGVLIVIGCAVEVLGIYIFNKMLTAEMITSAFSLLITVVAITRWGWKGLFVTPFLALATLLSGRLMNPHTEFRELYDWKLYVATLFQLLSLSVNFIWYKKYRSEEKTFKTLSSVFLITLLDSAVSLIVLSLVYLACSFRFMILGFLIWNAFAYALLLLGTLILGRQNILVNVKRALIAQKKELEFEKNFKFSLEEEKQTENSLEKKGDFKDGQDD